MKKALTTTAEPPAEQEQVWTATIKVTADELDNLCDEGVTVVSAHETDVDPRLLDYVNNMVYHAGAIDDPDYYSELDAGLMEGINPQDTIEAMIAGMAVSFFKASLCCQYNTRKEVDRCAGSVIQKLQQQQQQQCAKLAQGHARMFCNLIDTLNRHRGKTTPQKVVVERVDVSDGSQAIVAGQVQAGGGRRRGGNGRT